MRVMVHLPIVYGGLSERRDRGDDRTVRQAPGLKRLADVAMVGRTLQGADKTVLRALPRPSCCAVLRLKGLTAAGLTLDFDGSVRGSTRMSEGTAVGYDRKNKGRRSCHPPFCIAARTGQVLDIRHRSGTVHDCSDAGALKLFCRGELRQILPAVILNVRMDCTIFRDVIVGAREALDIQYIISVPFGRLARPKTKIGKHRLWYRADEQVSFLGRYRKSNWRQETRRLPFIRVCEPKQRKAPL